MLDIEFFCEATYIFLFFCNFLGFFKVFFKNGIAFRVFMCYNNNELVGRGVFGGKNLGYFRGK